MSRPMSGRMVLVTGRRGGRDLNASCKGSACKKRHKTAMRETGRHRVAFPSALDEKTVTVRHKPYRYDIKQKPTSRLPVTFTNSNETPMTIAWQ